MSRLNWPGRNGQTEMAQTETAETEMARLKSHVLTRGCSQAGAHLGGLFGCHDRPLCTTGTQH